ncbi:hypothetical protein T492DRAFT_846174 [Pavlovales sp. CCMP2436]|nr:hypothetical protein T492DRAFT_846174 [Pavlovales sp. CCMP2436]
MTATCVGACGDRAALPRSSNPHPHPKPDAHPSLAGTFGLICGLWLLYTYVSENAKLKLRVGDFEAGRATVGKKAADELKAQLRGEGEHARSGKPLAKKVQARNIALASILLVLANIDSYSPAAYDFWALGTALSVLLNFCAICAFIYMGLVQSQWGRSRVAEVSFVIELVAVPGLTLLLAIIYIPITRYALTAWYSYGVSCGRGFRFPELTVSLTETLSVSLRGGDIVCEPCVFASFDQEAVSWAHSLNFKTAGACLAQFCSSETTSKRSANDVRYNYGSIILSFLGPVSILTLLAVSIGIPLFNFRLTQQHSRSLSRLTVNKEFAKAVVELQEMTWRYHLFATRNRATSLYAPFRRAWRQTWLLVMAQRLIATVVTASFVGVRVADTVVMPAVHGLFLLFWLGARPFFDAKTSAFAVALAVASLFNALAIPIAVAQAGTDLTGDWTGLVISVNFCLPVLALLAFAYPSHRARRHMLRETDKFEEGLTLEEAEKEDALFLQLDKDLDAQTTRLASVSIFGLALVGFLTIGVTILVGLKQLEVSAVLPATSPIFGSRLSANNPSCEVERLVKKHEFAGFQSWPEFTANCCCAERETAAAYGTAAIVGRIELWTCANSEFANKERDREGDDLKARGFCSPAFTSGYSLPAYSSSLLQMAITRPDGKLIASGSGW